MVLRGVNAGAATLTLELVVGPGVVFMPDRFGAMSGMKGDWSGGETRFE